VPAFYGRREGDRVVIEGADARHLARSLRARPGEKIEVVDPDGWMLTVRLESISDSKIEGIVASERHHAPEPERHVVVAIAQLPSNALELVLSRCTEVGASAFQVVEAHRSIARGDRRERWQTIVREAAMLAGRLRVPIVGGPQPLAEVIAERPNPVMLVRGAPTPLAAMPRPREVTLLIGPEGGWTDRELAMVKDHAGLGPRNLRADTAAIVATAIAVGS
ncbi:MAG TPA: RsmE family RNA methyltransferase, partial [Candidatus Dormibacteraeota bacterium]|nr:RsmE family RNA methyltransferase [Candidatus Dormibacteraeota bacterium]